MKLITNENNIVYYGDAEHSFVDGYLFCEDSYWTDCLEDNAVVYTEVTVPDDFNVFKYDYDGSSFSLSEQYTTLSNEKRTERNTLLAETDWWAVSDRTMTQDETDYRQALRDVPQQEGFPTDITWPTKPQEKP